MANIFVHEVIKIYFKLNNSWVPRDKKLLKIIFEVDIILYELIKASLKEQDLNQKIKICHDILVYVLRLMVENLTHGISRSFRFNII